MTDQEVSDAHALSDAIFDIFEGLPNRVIVLALMAIIAGIGPVFTQEEMTNFSRIANEVENERRRTLQ